MAPFTHDFARGKRIQKMDECGVDVQVLSLSVFGIEQFDSKIGIDLAHKTNDTLYQVAKRYPNWTMGCKVLAPRNPKAAVDILQRMVMELGFKEWNTHSNYGDTVLDDPAYHPILEKAEELGVPVSIHPTVPAFAQ